MLNRKRLKADLLLLLVAVIWGSAFVAQRIAALESDFFLYNAARFFVASIFLLLLLRRRPEISRNDLAFSALTGCVLFIASAFQQAGLKETSAGNAGFITTLYVVFVPLLTYFIWRHKVSVYHWGAASLAIIGAFLLSTGTQLQHVSRGDVLELIGAFAWAFHVILIGEGAKRIPALLFTFWQLIFAASLNLFFSIFFGSPSFPGLMQVSWSVLYTGVFSIGLGYFLQTVGQRDAPAVDASLILCLESVFAALGGWLFLRESLTLLQFIGCLLILFAALFVQVVAQRSEIPA